MEIPNAAHSTNTDGIKNDKYLLSQSAISDEVSRLNMQYKHLKAVLGYDDILELPFSISEACNAVNILDVATGTGVWILDVARIPEIQSRLPATGVPNPVNLYACDISAEKFPEKSKVDSLDVNFFLQDITRPFPQNMWGKFDLVHMALLSWALTEDGWNAAFRNIYHILKPGGHLLIMDYDVGIPAPVEQSLQNPCDDIRNVEAYFTSIPSLLNLVNAITISTMARYGLLIKLSRRFPDMLRLASLTPVSSKIAKVYYGSAAAGQTGLNGKSLEQYIESAMENVALSLDAVSRWAFSRGHLEIPRGNKITTEEHRIEVLTKLLADIEEEGSYQGLSEWLAQKQT